MTANEDALVDLDVLEAELPLHYFDCDRFNGTVYGTQQGKCDCTATRDIRSLIAEVAELRSRASISPDSERIREAEQVVTFAFADVSKLPEWMQVPAIGRYMAPLGELAVAALRAAGLLPGPDDIVVSREALDHVWLCAGGPGYCDLCDKIRAALSQPHPAQEQQT